MISKFGFDSNYILTISKEFCRAGIKKNYEYSDAIAFLNYSRKEFHLQVMVVLKMKWGKGKVYGGEVGQSGAGENNIVTNFPLSSKSSPFPVPFYASVGSI
ncbi:hypothetical protein CBP28_02620 [Fischerella thermalis WC559]|nr:hypothetical protein CBP17_18010 [Fischerella thermalis WC114]PLZ10367.1 hypothetical protein CBP18_11020 [Fischerella thermalis WC119]PLZ10612.1 hypothetical protein CBP19_14420 [Fischerella thermalis WC1110]PLZ17342.1 hypothetical protein CBP30_19285 [Fischerella thermalis WC157]PLZ17777.1 hypothetical protein CBP29_20675 [Fischerella thermalis WC341]PLZ33932.1 hypothetical protein CBP28_02620 [Fischerella thermalis WC559]PLZ35187.1 hypothetical protein CBP10_03975 [Fischerella thermalis